nr:MAG TPA: Minor capsid protein [Caudoviricetes sp.]
MFKSTYILRRFEKSDHNGYRSYTDQSVQLNVQSLNAKELQALPEGERSFDRVKSFGKDEVHTVNQRTGIPADQLYCNGKWYECEQASQWAHTPLAHWECQWVALPEGQQADPPEVRA